MKTTAHQRHRPRPTKPGPRHSGHAFTSIGARIRQEKGDGTTHWRPEIPTGKTDFVKSR
jgi:hypothetical protein